MVYHEEEYSENDCTEYDPDGEDDDERPPAAEAGTAAVRQRTHHGRQEEADQRGEAPDHRHVLVAHPCK